MSLDVAIDVHLRVHMTDGRWHDGCRFCLARRRHGGTGIESHIRSQAVEIVDGRHGYTYEFSSAPNAHLQEYDDEEQRLLNLYRGGV